MKMNKKFISILLALSFLLSFVGCDVQPLDSESVNSELSLLMESVSDESSGFETSSESSNETSKPDKNEVTSGENQKFDLSKIPAFSGYPFAVVNDNIPSFSESELTTTSYEFYSELDSLGRCGYTIASVGKDIMPTEDRGNIGMVKPTGWHTVKYDNVDGKYLYNRCHLIGFQLTGENANVKNLITGTRYMNVDGMLPFENMIADYVKETNNHVAYRVTPIFEGNNLLATGVLMEAFSVEDEGEGICFNVFCYNVQPDITIDYKTGESKLAEESGSDDESKPEVSQTTYVLNTSSKKFHKLTCRSLPTNNRQDTNLSRDEIISLGYSPCGNCKP
jgi:DNA-entry nuclease